MSNKNVKSSVILRKKSSLIEKHNKAKTIEKSFEKVKKTVKNSPRPSIKLKKNSESLKGKSAGKANPKNITKTKVESPKKIVKKLVNKSLVQSLTGKKPTESKKSTIKKEIIITKKPIKKESGIKTKAVEPTIAKPKKEEARNEVVIVPKKSTTKKEQQTTKALPGKQVDNTKTTPETYYVDKNHKEPPGKFELEYVVHSSAQILFDFLTSPSGLSEWFCDDVNIRNGIYSFVWDGSKQEAKLVRFVEDKVVRFQWADKPDGSFFEFRIEKDDLTSDISLIVADFADTPDDKNSSKLLWDSQIHKLLQVLGSYF